ncbi:MAG: MauE/DoxX family redox-associated membrane protein [Iamia sp.]
MILASLSPTTGLLLAAAALLAAAGAAKLERPAPTGLALARLGLPGSDLVVRALGGAEIASATAAAFLAGWWALPVAVLYLGFALFSGAQVRRAAATGEAADCGCFGDSSAPIGWSHVLLNVALGVAAVLAAAARADGLLTGLSDDLVATLVVTSLAALAAVGIRALLTDLPALRALRRNEAA